MAPEALDVGPRKLLSYPGGEMSDMDTTYWSIARRHRRGGITSQGRRAPTSS